MLKSSVAGSIVILCVLVHLIQAGKQTIGVRGRLKCGDDPLKNAIVKLWEHDTIGPNDELECVRTDANGNFEVEGSQSEIFKISPLLKIYTDCNARTIYGAAEKSCQRVIQVDVPKNFINNAEFYNLETFNIGDKQKNEAKKCDLEKCEQTKTKSQTATMGRRTTRAPAGNCRDDMSDCAAWAERGDCQVRPGLLQVHCKKSCGVC